MKEADDTALVGYCGVWVVKVTARPDLRVDWKNTHEARKIKVFPLCVKGA